MESEVECFGNTHEREACECLDAGGRAMHGEIIEEPKPKVGLRLAQVIILYTADKFGVRAT